MASVQVRTRRISTADDGTVDAVEIRLPFPMAFRLCGIPLRELSSIAVDAHDVWGDADRRFEELQATKECAVGVQRLIGSWCAASCAASDPDHERIWQHLSSSSAGGSVAEIAERVGWSTRQLQRKCGAAFGLTPKELLQLIRFDRAAHDIADGIDHTTVAHRHGYVDASHLHRAARRFADPTPTEIAQLSVL